MVLSKGRSVILRGLGLAALCLASWRGGYVHSVSQTEAIKQIPEGAPIKTPSGDAANWRPPTSAEAAKAAAAEDHDGDNEASVSIVSSTPQDDSAAAQATVPELDKRLLAGISDLRVVVRTGSADNTFSDEVTAAGVTAGFIKAQIENQVRQSKAPLRLSDASENILEYDVYVGEGQPCEIKSELRLIRAVKLNAGSAGTQTALAVLWERGIEASAVGLSELRQRLANDAANGARSLVSDRDEVIRESNKKE